MWKETIVAYFEVLWRRLRGENYEHHENLTHDGRAPGQDLELGLRRWPANYMKHRPSWEVHSFSANEIPSILLNPPLVKNLISYASDIYFYIVLPSTPRFS
jgi:hypothetical protein